MMPKESDEQHIVEEFPKLNKKLNYDGPPETLVPKNKVLLCHCLFFLLGICHFVPLTFFSACNNFWLYKFRNTSQPDNSSVENRSSLQINYSSSSLIISTVVSLIFGIFNLTYSQRFELLNRLFFTLFTGLIIFITYTISTNLETDKFQLPYFIYVLTSYGFLSAVNCVNLVASITLFPRFPSKFTHTCLLGQATTGILGDCLNVISIWAFNNDTLKGTFLYFILGSCAYSLAFILLFIASRMKFFTECMNSKPVSTEKKIPPFKEIKSVSKKISYPLFIMYFYLVTTILTQSTISLVVSENSDTDSVWAKHYFSPVMSFLLANVCTLIGRLIISTFRFEVPKLYCIPISILRTVILIPMVWFCNAQPRHFLPLLFPHDYQYGIILAILMLTGGMLMSYSIILIPKSLEGPEVDLGYNVFYFSVTILQVLHVPFSIIVANYL